MAPLFVTQFVAVNRSAVSQGISVQRFSWTLSKDGSIQAGLYGRLTVLKVLSVYSPSRYRLCSLSTCSHTMTDLILVQFEYVLEKIIQLPSP
jgi:hypothetical protein